MVKNIFVLYFILMLLSCCYVLGEETGLENNKKKMDEKFLSRIKRRLEILYKLSSYDKSEVFVREIDSIKEHLNILNEGGWESTEGRCNGNLTSGINKAEGAGADMPGGDLYSVTESESDFGDDGDAVLVGCFNGHRTPGHMKNAQGTGKGGSKSLGKTLGKAMGKGAGKAVGKAVSKVAKKLASKVEH
ncbi:hypothetical protein AK88_04055 [Plasmodium fragile]|uniref:Uncharacterized protein n=1 Tax=Plasmodium fragile TaxID=5857 RepID=A0A0D9QKT2_PLAFR|nr:uncharacterized protein AK88_04055 [Plasmodium fragile]KJP86336.1 hypothetical protein AK88_04055 [Plasmodium fragile]